ncbi:MAG TPA: bifunctional phosphoglucose/phosphomannose isomerase [Candidatus Limnocylindrales bacterium]|nr:bifunctional phosphoglucose/phosphomannose isomerase [Candidatus Limnocylindrales bacterium]
MNNSKDPSDLRKVLLESPDQFKVGFDLAKNIKIDGEFDKIMISGMGGSALPGNLLRIYLQDLHRQKKSKPTAIFQNRFYSLPHESYDKCLNIISSFSGTTEEAISSFKEALENKLPCIGISSGGDIEKMCHENNIPHVKLPVPYPNFQPRTATGYFFASILQILINQNLAPDVTEEILNMSGKLKQELPNIESAGKELAKKIVGKTPVIYASAKYKGVAMVWKIKFNEHSKTPAFWNFFPELNHNEMIGYTNPQSKFFILMLRDPQDNPKNLNRFEATSGLLRDKGIDVQIIDFQGDDVFYKIFHSLILGDFSAYYLALEYGQDPTPVDMVEQLKSILAEMK